MTIFPIPAEAKQKDAADDVRKFPALSIFTTSALLQLGQTIVSEVVAERTSVSNVSSQALH